MIPLLLGLAVPAALAGAGWVSMKVKQGEEKAAEIATSARQVASGTEASAKLAAIAAAAAGATLLILVMSDSSGSRRRR